MHFTKKDCLVPFKTANDVFVTTRSTGEGPGQVNLDLAIFKSFFNRDAGGHLWPNELQFRVEAGNVPNTAEFQNPNRILGTSEFGSMTDIAWDIQFALKLCF
jgi:hypothetical protein